MIELRPVGGDSAAAVWRWRVWDHLIQHFDSSKHNFGAVSDHPELIDLNFPDGTMQEDWLHFNSVAYNPDFDQVMVSCHHTGEIWIIDHGTKKIGRASCRERVYVLV